MSSSRSFTPGGNGLTCAQVIKNYTLYSKKSDFSNSKYICPPLEERISKDKPGYVTTFQSNAMRQSNILSSTHLEGRYQYGNGNVPVAVNSAGGANGQPGGLPRPLRNKF